MLHNFLSLKLLQGYCGLRNFIAAQAPMGTTEEDVWNMIWKETCTTVVVLCNFIEDSEVRVLEITNLSN